MENESNSLQSRLILECQELCDQYDLCRARLHQLAKEVEALRQENSDLRSANRELVEHLNILSEARMRENFLCYDFRRLSVGEGHGVDEMNHSGRSNKAASPQPLNNPLVHATCGREQQRSHVPRGRGAEEEEEEEEAVKVEVYNQGMFKTELCNKWQEKARVPTAISASSHMASPSSVPSSGTHATRLKFVEWFSPAPPVLMATAAISATPFAHLD
ncbi:Zinc finger CCCH domain-containing protein 15 [Vitis vinifera]|uniref:Zinc finger CCCH domain-containing protein 15 n=1 Tax=Vitis vinifera TaxID=29760 RepID=A0A438GZ09_VITVI|nr:Zinc finger CCCH domain-containing protein 15 [Vitis vinifera]